MKSLKSVIALLLIASFTLGLFGCSDKNEYDGTGLEDSVFLKTESDDEYVYDVYEDYSIITEYKGEDTRVTIPSKLGGKTVKGLGDNSIGISRLAIDIVDIPKNLVYISPSAFSECTTATIYSVNGYNPVYKSEDGIIYSKDGKTLLHYPSGKKDTSVSVPGDVEAIGGYAFANNEKVTQIKLPSGVAKIGSYAFWGCDNLNKINFPDKLTEIGDYAFFECQSIGSLDLPDGLFKIGAHAFDYCVSIKETVIPDSVVQIGDGAFNSCISLCDVTLPASLDRYGYSVFTGCILLKEFKLAPGNSKFRVSAGVLYSYDGDELVDYPYGKSDDKVKIPQNVISIRDYAFARDGAYSDSGVNDFIVEIDFANVEKIGAHAFANTDSITAVNLPSSLKEINSTAFYNCKKLKEYKLSNCENYKVDKGVLYTADNKTLLAYPPSSDLTEYTVLDGTEKIDNYAFSLSEYLTRLNLPDTLKIVGDYAFYRAGAITELVFSDSLEQIGEASFSNTISLEKIEIPDNTIDEIPYRAFASTDGLFEFTIPTGVRVIGDEAFTLSPYIYSIVIPETVEEIGEKAFFDMDNLHELFIPKAVKVLGDLFFDKYDNNFVARVYEGSYAETFAKENDYPYELIK